MDQIVITGLKPATETSSDKVQDSISKKWKKWKIVEILVLSVFFVADITLFIIYTKSSDQTWKMIVPNHWTLFKSSVTHTMSNGDYQEAVRRFRSITELPEQYDWLDQREIPEFPYVYGPKKFVCAYNNLDYC